MPLYEYECQQCHRRTEKIQKFSDAELTVCPHCGGRLERTITAAAISFKGGGWYKDLYSSAKPAAASGDGAPAAAGSGEGSKSSGEGSAGSGEGSKTSGEGSKTSGEGSKPAAAPAAAASAPASPAKP